MDAIGGMKDRADYLYTKKQYIKITLYYGNQSQGSYMTTPEEALNIDTLCLGELAEGDSYKLESVFMSEYEYRALPEFWGF